MKTVQFMYTRCKQPITHQLLILAKPMFESSLMYQFTPGIMLNLCIIPEDFSIKIW